MGTRVRCLKCFKIIECSPYDTSILFDHIVAYHPEIKLPKDDAMNQQEPISRPTMQQEWQRDSLPKLQFPPTSVKMEEITIQRPGQKPLYTRKYKIYHPQEPKNSQAPTSPRTPKSPQRRRMYKTSVEKWRPAKGTIYCPKCGAKKKPIIRSRSEKMSYTTAGAACILTCWPLCFLPCLFSPPTRDFLHCAECNNFLGMYDKQNNCIRPNRDFVESGGYRSNSCDNFSKKTREEMDPERRPEQRKSV